MQVSIAALSANWRALIVGFSAFTVVAACSSAPASAPEGTVKLDTKSVFSQIQKAIAASHKSQTELLVNASQRTFPEIYQSLLERLSDQRVEVNGTVVDHARSRVVQNRSAFLALDSAFRTLNDYWQAIGFDPRRASLDYQSFASNPSLSLVVAPSCNLLQKAVGTVWPLIKDKSTKPRHLPSWGAGRGGYPGAQIKPLKPQTGDYSMRTDTEDLQALHDGMGYVLPPYLSPDRLSQAMQSLGGPDALFADGEIEDELQESGVHPDTFRNYLITGFQQPGDCSQAPSD